MIRRVRIDEALWGKASPARRDDWRVSISDLVDGRIGHGDDELLHVGVTPRAVVFATFDAAGAPSEVREVPRTELRPHVDEYVAVIRRIMHDDAGHLHALDMAKKVVHDTGARTLARVLPRFARDHESYRRLFSLVLALLVDVTAMPHRRHA